MSTVPSKLPEQVAWYQTRETPWTTSATDIGISTAEMTTMSGYISAASDALSAYNSAHAAAKSATTTLHNTCDVMNRYGADLIRKIRAKAGQVGGDSVYATAMIPPPATPTPVGELSKPSDFSVALDETGAITLAWKCAQPQSASAVVYQVWRRIGNTGAFVCLGASGVKEFHDATIPAGTASATYKIQAQRSTSTSAWAQFTVSFGVDSGETTIESVVVDQPKIAA